MRDHYTITSNVLLFGYPGLSDNAKITYQVIDSFDWTDAAGTRKGFAYPSLRSLARIRGIERRTIRRHLAELEAAKLITRVEQTGQPSLLIIEDPSTEEAAKYLRTFAKVGEDKNVLPPSDKNVRPLKKEKGEEDKLVNEEQALSGVEERPRVTKGSGSTIALSERIPRAKREYLANEILSVCRDEKSLGYYRKVADTIEPQQIFEALSIVKQLAREGQISKSRGAAFSAIISQREDPRRDPPRAGPS